MENIILPLLQFSSVIMQSDVAGILDTPHDVVYTLYLRRGGFRYNHFVVISSLNLRRKIKVEFQVQ